MTRLSVNCPNKEIERQSQYSVHNSLLSRSQNDAGQTIFIHSRRDRGYSDVAKMHQSFQMHLVALAAGETNSVREELLAYAALQDTRGNMARQPRPGRGSHPYTGLYSNANFIMALYRYLSWTGDFTILNETVGVFDDPNVKRTLLMKAILAVDWLLANQWQGVIAPCGWVDGWPRGVKAQTQMSAAALIALRNISVICAYLGKDHEALKYAGTVQELQDSIHEVFYDPTTGLVAEHLFESGNIAGNQTTDFWATTQIWTALAGLAPDVRGLELCRVNCMETGMMMMPESTMSANYVMLLDTSIEELDFGSNATWSLAAWPELTHLYALAELRYGRPDQALDAIFGQLPERIHESNRLAAPYYYAEKYIYPYTTPWLCTWGGDPMLLEVLLEGFAGLHMDIDGMKVKPRLPTSWMGDNQLRIRFWYRDNQWDLIIDQEEGRRKTAIVLDGRDIPIDHTIERRCFSKLILA